MFPRKVQTFLLLKAFPFQFEGSRCLLVIQGNVLACCTTLSMCLSSYIGWQMENPVNCVENASALEPNDLSRGWAVQNS